MICLFIKKIYNFKNNLKNVLYGIKVKLENLNNKKLFN